VEFRVVGPGDEAVLAEVFRHIDARFFRPHSFTSGAARRIARRRGRDLYAVLIDDDQRAVAYGMLRGWDEGYPTPSLGIAVRTDCQGRGFGRRMMEGLHLAAAQRGATAVRLRVHPDNIRARRLYESLGYVDSGEERGELVMEITLPNRAGAHARSDTRLTAELLPVDSPQWLAFLAATNHDFYHLPGYVALCAEWESGEARALLVRGDRGSLLLPIIIRDIPSGGRDAVSPYGYPGPLVLGDDDPEFLRRALAEGVRALRRDGVVSLFVRLHPILNPGPPAELGTAVRHGETVSIDLSLPAAVIWNQTRENHRRNIVRATALGYVARMDTDWAHFGDFKRLYRMTMDRHAASRLHRFDDTYFNSLRDALGDVIHLAVVEKDGAVVAATLFAETDGIVEYHLSGNDGSGANVQPTKLLIDFARRWAQSRGNRHLHLGGGVGGRADSLLAFKLGFSPLVRPFWTLRIVIDEPRYRQLVAELDPSLDADVRDGFFPLYRAETPSPASPDAEGGR
jgi:ribosomal protein S18 acetylase RimI-like enzyme